MLPLLCSASFAAQFAYLLTTSQSRLVCERPIGCGTDF